MKFSEIVKDPTFLVASSKFFGNIGEQKKKRIEHIEKLSKAILKVISDHGYAMVRSVGYRARLNALDAIELASSLCRNNTGLILYIEVMKDYGNIGELKQETHVQDVEAWVFKTMCRKVSKEI